jgi:predicted metallopeptidase
MLCLSLCIVIEVGVQNLNVSLPRIHGLGRIWQEALRRPSAYVVEVISEQYDKLSDEEKEKTVIHELLHIPKGFSGGFRPHKGYIDKKQVERLHNVLLKRRSLNPNNKRAR